jgi:prepilin-type N-terminal cleavage/methylation domain-containing protein
MVIKPVYSFLGESKMTSRKGFTLIELMVVIFIVGILAAVAIPIMRGRIDAAKWSEAKAAMGSIRTSARAYIAEKGNSWTYAGTTLTQLGFATGDLDGKYFTPGTTCYTIVFADVAGGASPPTYTITATAASSTSADKPTSPSVVTLKQDGTFTETP